MVKCRVEGWTDGRYRSFVFSQIRAGMRRYPPKFQCLKNAKRGKKVNEATGRQAEHYECNGCNKHFPQKQVQVDHIKPVVDPRKGFVDWNTYIDRMYCSIKNFQVLCKGCHLKKTKFEKTMRKNSNVDNKKT